MISVVRIESISLYVATVVSLDPVVQRTSDDQACLPSTFIFDPRNSLLYNYLYQ